MPFSGASCDPTEVVHVERAAAFDPDNVGIGVIDTTNGAIRLFTYDETNAFSRTNPTLQVMAGHEAAAAMCGISVGDCRGFVLAKVAADWHVFNQSHLNRSDGCTNPMRMAADTFDAIVAALVTADVANPVLH